MHASRIAPVLLMTALLAGCAAAPSSSTPFAPSPPAGRAVYPGPLVAVPTAEEARHPDRWPGAAGRVVRCSTVPRGATVIGTNTEGAAAEDPRKAIDTRLSEGLFLDLPVRNFALERDDGDRVLFTTSYNGIARQAVVVRDGPSGPGTGATNGRGWYVESYATCDLADFPETVSAAAGVEVWTDGNGTRVPTTTVVSARGPAHCDLQGTTLLTLEDEHDAEADEKALPRAYVDAVPKELRGYFSEPARPHVVVPGTAMDTGFEREGRHLWLSADRSRAYVGTRTDAALWPRETRAVGCA